MTVNDVAKHLDLDWKMVRNWNVPRLTWTWEYVIKRAKRELNMDRKRWSIEEKLNIVLEILKTEESIVDICRRYQVSSVQAYRWRDAFLEGGKSALKDHRKHNGKDPLLEENRRLKEIVDGLSLIVEAQKNLLGCLLKGKAHGSRQAQRTRLAA